MQDESKLENKFNKSVELIKNCERELSDSEKSSLYGLYKQSTIGDINITCPSMLFDYVGYRKWNSWKEHEGKPKNVAMNEYIQTVEMIMN